VRRLPNTAPVDPSPFDQLVTLPALTGGDADEKRDDDENEVVALHQRPRKV
jgi:hypothetical protein